MATDQHNHHLHHPPAPLALPTGTFRPLPRSIGTSTSRRVNRGTDTVRQASLRRLQHAGSQLNSQGGRLLLLLQGALVALLRPGLQTSSGRCSIFLLLTSSTDARRPTPAPHPVNNFKQLLFVCFFNKQVFCLFRNKQLSTSLHSCMNPLTHA